MLHRPTLNTPFARETLYLEPSLLAAKLRPEENLLLLESVMRHEHLGRYSYLACNPSHVLKVERGQTIYDGSPVSEKPLALQIGRAHV